MRAFVLVPVFFACFSHGRSVGRDEAEAIELRSLARALLAVSPARAAAHAPTNQRTSRSPQMLNRRDVAGGMASVLAAAALLPRGASADDDDAMAKILAKNQKAAETAREEEANKVVEDTSTFEKLLPAIVVLGGGTALSVPFFSANLQRLGTKVASGGQDDGYGGKGKNKRR
mmetsp:Transcript_99030/g.156116  ORF Transcript_99030/g.156116 Transcript_99030/m.156116 type:complete len:173 (+) Transcript_99030:62-580(+)